MKKSSLFAFFLVVAMSAALVAALLGPAPAAEDEGPVEGLLAGRNVNMVSGTTLPGGDPWLQRQNEPSVAVSTRNPQHLLAGANDYRTVDVPFSEGPLPSIPGMNAGDAWLGIFKSLDGGASWTTSLLPGFPQDVSPEGQASPLKQFSTAADPIVRAGANGMFYYSGMAFNRGQTQGGGSLFLARFIDNNVEEGDPIKYLDTKIIQIGNPGMFIDMPRIAVDVPRNGRTVRIDGRAIPRSNVYAAYTVFLGAIDITVRSQIMFRRSTDCGQTWGPAIKITESQHIIQGATMAIDPNSGALYIAFRRFADPSQPDAMVIVRSTDFGRTFTKPAVIAITSPFDQPTTDDVSGPPFGTSFRTSSHPTLTVDDNGIVYVAWTERGWGPAFGEARIVLYTSQDGVSWIGPQSVENHLNMGHQFMPFLTFAGGKLTMAWYDQRDSASVHYFGVDSWISDINTVRQTIDIRAAQAEPGLNPSFEPSVQVSRYLWAIFGDGSIDQVQYNPPNYPLFKGGMAAFIGDYIEVTPSPAFVRDASGAWKFNTAPSNAPVFHVVWADNRDVRPPDDGISWDKYTPPASNQGVFGTQSCGSVTVPNMGMRNQNIYTAVLTRGMIAAAPVNAKPLGTGLGYYYGTNDLIQRAFIIYVKNPGDAMRAFRLSIEAPPVYGTASFLEFESLDTLDVTIAPYSAIARTVYVRSMDPDDSVIVKVVEIDWAGNEVPDGLASEVVLNGDPTNPQIPSDTDEIHNPNIRNSEIVNWAEVASPNIRNGSYLNPNIVNPNIVNPNIVNPNIRNPNIVNPNIVNPNIVNPNIRNPNIVNPNIVNPNIRNESLEDPDVYDVMCTVVNEGNTATAYTLKTFSKEAIPDGLYLQILVYKVHYTAAADEDGDSANACLLKLERHHDLLLNIANPNIRNPNIVNPNIRNPNIRNESVENATFSLAAGEEAEVIVRIIKPDASEVMTVKTFDALTNTVKEEVFDIERFAESIGVAATSQAVNTKEAREEGVISPPAAASKLIIGTGSLPDGIVGAFYAATLTAYGGMEPYSWAFTAGELPPGLFIGSDGTISGTPTAAGLYYFVVRVDDSAGDFDTQRYSIYVDNDGQADALTIATTSLPGGVLNNWYGATLQATGGVWPRTWSLYSGSLPLGLELDSEGVISGRIEPESGPDYPTTFTFTVKVTDRTGVSATKALGIYVNIDTGAYVTISGTVYDELGDPLGGVVMRGLPNTPVTNTAGYYEDSVPYLWSGTVIPFKAGHAFTPESRTYINVAADQSDQDYGAPPVTLVPDIQVRQDKMDIPDGSSYNLGTYAIGSETDVVLTIDNFGTAGLVITTPLTISGPDADQWSILAQPTSPVPPNESTTFTLRFKPLTEGVKNAAIAIANNDPDENPYDISLTGICDFFTKVFSGEIVTDGGVSYSCAWGDYDNDGDLDLFVANYNQNDFLYMNDGDGTFTKVASGAIVEDVGYSYGCAWGDYDNDGDLDLFVVNALQNNFLYANNGDGSFTKEGTDIVATDGGYSSSCAWGDYDNDGDLDLFVANLGNQNNFLYTNNGDGSFTKVTDGPVVTDGGTSYSCAWGDYDNDGDLDLFVANGSDQNNFLYRNSGDGTFVKVVSGAIVEDGGYSLGCAWADYDNDGDLDLFVANTNGQNNFLYTNNGDGSFTKVTSGDGVTEGGTSSGCAWGDYDNDGDLDLFVANGGQISFLYKNNGDGSLSRVTSGAVVADDEHSGGCAWGDYDNDGDLDLFVANYSGPTNSLYENNGTGNNWINIRCAGSSSNTSAIGTKVKLKAIIQDVTRWQLREISGGNGSQDSLNAEFGLGDADIIDEISIEWPSGVVQTLTDVEVNQFLTVTEPEEYEFVLKWGTLGAADGQFNNPFDVAIDGSGDVYVTDNYNYRVQKFTSEGVFLTKWGTNGSGNGQFNAPFGVAVDDSGYVYVTDDLNNRVQKFSSSGDFVAAWGNAGTETGEFDRPAGIAVDTSGLICVTDIYNYRIQKFTAAGGFMTSWGSSGDGDGQFDYHMGIAVDSLGDVYVADTDHHRIQKFSSDGTFLGWWGRDDLGHSGWHEPGSGRTGVSGDGDGEFHRPIGLAVDGSDNVYVADFANHRIQKFTSTGVFQTKWGNSGTGDGEFMYPMGVAVDDSGNVYVAEYENHRIQKFKRK